MLEDEEQTELFPLDMLTNAVRTALHIAQGSITDWHVVPIFGGLSSVVGASAGIYRVHGTLDTKLDTKVWSLILKIVGPTSDEDTLANPSYWQREALAYQSALRSLLPPGLDMPRCFAVHQTNTRCWLWLEDLGHMRETRWSSEQYARAAYKLGQLNGIFLVQIPIPEWPWLSRNWLRNWVEAAAPEALRLTSLKEHKLLRRWFPERDFARVIDLWSRREVMLAKLETLPHTLCHLDANRRNMRVQLSTASEESISLIDWANCGIAAVGEELAWLVWASYFLFEVEPEEVDELESIALTHYISGLRATGWLGDERDVHIGYTIGSALRNATAFGIDAVLDTQKHTEIEQAFGAPLELCLDRWADINNRVLTKLSIVEDEIAG